MSRKWQDEVTPLLRRLQLIVAAITIGCAVVLAIVLLIAKPPDADRQPLITYVALAVAVLAIVSRIAFVGAIVTIGRRAIARDLPTSTRDNLRDSGDLAPSADLLYKLWGLCTMRIVGGAAVLEAAAFFLAVAYFLEGFWPAPAAAALLIIGLLLHTPTRSGLILWTETQLRLLDEERL